MQAEACLPGVPLCHNLYPYVPQRLCPHSSPTALLPRCPQEGKEDSDEVTKFQTVRRSQEVQSRSPQLPGQKAEA